MANILDLDTKKYIIIKGAQLHNLKHVDAVFPRNKMTVVTGLSGSGKSSLVFDTLYAEGQRRYVESLSSYARQFMGKLNKPKVDEIKGIAPAIAVEQKVSSSNPRSTVGTKTEIYDYLRLLYARIGKTFSPISGKQVKSDSVKDVLESLKNEFTDGEKLLLLAPINDPIEKRNDRLGILKQQGFARIFVNGEVLRIEEITKAPKENYALVVDRIIVRQEEDFYQRVADAIEIAFYEGKGACLSLPPIFIFSVLTIHLELVKNVKVLGTSLELTLNWWFPTPVDLFLTMPLPHGGEQACENFTNNSSKMPISLIFLSTNLIIN
jgi:excinuclease ABC subunit A